MSVGKWWKERKARKETKRRLKTIVATTAGVRSLEEPIKSPTEDDFSPTSAFLLVKKSVDEATEAKAKARGAAQRILGMFEKHPKK
jgi:hypothetical protein